MDFATQFGGPITFTESQVGAIALFIGVLLLGIIALPSALVVLWRLLKNKLPIELHTKIIAVVYLTYLVLAAILMAFGSTTTDSSSAKTSALFNFISPALVMLGYLSALLLLGELVSWVVRGLLHVFSATRSRRQAVDVAAPLGMPNSPPKPKSDIDDSVDKETE